MRAAVDELRLLANAADNVRPPSEAFRFFDDALVDDDDDHFRFVRWVSDEFMQGSLIHSLFLIAGATGAILFEEDVHNVLGDERRAASLAEVEHTLRQLLTLVLHRFRQLGPTIDMPDRVVELHDKVRRALGLHRRYALKRTQEVQAQAIAGAWPLVVSLADSVFEDVFHKHAAVAVPNTIDWKWLQQGVREMRERGETSAGVILLPNGQLVTGPTIPREMSFFPLVIEDLDNQVPFLDRSHGLAVMKVVAWEDLRSGVAFEPGYRLKRPETP
jgi:hypothetical protein